MTDSVLRDRRAFLCVGRFAAVTPVRPTLSSSSSTPQHTPARACGVRHPPAVSAPSIFVPTCFFMSFVPAVAGMGASSTGEHASAGSAHVASQSKEVAAEHTTLLAPTHSQSPHRKPQTKQKKGGLRTSCMDSAGPFAGAENPYRSSSSAAAAACTYVGC